MPEAPAPNKEDKMAQLATDRLQTEFSGELIRPDDPQYDALRQVFNAAVDRHPALIARCTGRRDVIAAVNHAREHGLEIAVYGGGHGVRGHAVCDDGMVIDLRPMKRIRIDAARRRAQVQAGATWRDFDSAAQAHGLAITGGRVSTTGVSGFTLGSGSGWLERKLGLAADSLISAEVILADGSLATVSERQHPELFWGLRGGSGNFGIVTNFEFALHPVGPIVLGGMLIHPASRAPEVLCAFRDFMAGAPDEVGAGAALITAPPAPFVPELLRGKPALGIVLCYVGDPAEGERVIAPLRAYGPPAADLVQPMPYTALQQLIDPTMPAGLHNHWGGDFLAELPDDAIDAFCAAALTVPSPLTQILIVPGGGQLARVDDDAMAIGQRQAPWNTHLLTVWSDPADTARNMAWLRALQAAIEPYTTGHAWLNFLGDEGEHRVRRALGQDKYERMRAIKDRYDPANLFHLNQNIPPTRSQTRVSGAA
jgi:FAD/FMN-containing dehydrogenase